MNINSKDCLLIQFIYVFSFAFFQTQISRDTGVHEATIRGWLKSEDKLRDYALTCEDGDGLARKKLRRVNDPPLDKAVFTWFSQATQDGAPVSGPLLQAQAEKMHVATDALPTLPATDCHAPSVAQDIPTAQKAVWHMEQALHFLENCPDVDELEVIQMKSLISKTKGRLRRKQAWLTDYFTPRNVSD